MPREDFFDIVYDVKTSEETKAIYERWANVYDEDLSSRSYRQPARCANALHKQQPDKNITILDAGCGTGLAAIALKAVGYEALHGCDFSDAMLEKANKLQLYKTLKRQDLNNVPIDYESGMFDAVTAVGVFSFSHVNPKAIVELARVVRSGGTIIIGMNDHFFTEGSLLRQLEHMEETDTLEIISKEHGEHVPGNDLKGWVITLLKR